MKFKDNLRKQRSKVNLSQEDLAEKMSVSRQTVSKWENGDTYPSTRHILILAKILNCSIDNLIDCNITSAENQILDNSVQIAPNRRNYIYLLAGIALAIIIFGFSLLVCGNNAGINNSKIAAFDSIVDGSLDDAMALDGYAKKRIVGYGTTETDGIFYIKCDAENNNTGELCSAIIYFCEKNGRYEYRCQYLDDPDYLPEGEYYKVG